MCSASLGGSDARGRPGLPRTSPRPNFRTSPVSSGGDAAPAYEVREIASGLARGQDAPGRSLGRSSKAPRENTHRSPARDDGTTRALVPTNNMDDMRFSSILALALALSGCGSAGGSAPDVPRATGNGGQTN